MVDGFSFQHMALEGHDVLVNRLSRLVRVNMFHVEVIFYIYFENVHIYTISDTSYLISLYSRTSVANIDVF